MHTPEKARISAAFDRAAHNYDLIARFQHSVSDSLAEFLLSFAPDIPAPSTLLDGGCGTGYGADILSRIWPHSRITGCDLSIEMLKLAKVRQIDVVCADLEQLPFGNRHFDFIWSSLALQWCKTPDVYTELYRVLAKEGVLLFTTLGPGTLVELDFAFSAIDTHRHVRAFSSVDEVKDALEKAGFVNIRVLPETRIVHYPDFNSFLMSIRGIGANQVGSTRRRSMMGKNAWEKVKERYDTLQDANGMLPATYELIFGFAQRRI
jgi:malonyl-CoA O-methyltransferase